MILETKLSLPQPKAGALLRAGLIELIKNNLDKKLILITADAGYGKTTLLLQLVKTAKLPAIFYHLDQGDSDLLTFYSYLVAGLEQLSPGLAARSSGLLKQAEQIGNDHELLMGTLINELMEKRKEELFFVLDDYQHLAENSPVHQALDFFIDHMPESVHVIIASRAAVRFANYAKWYAKQNAFEVRRSDLRFSEDDVQELLTKSYNQTLVPDDLKSLLEHTEGWITGIQLVIADIRGARKNKTVKEALAGYLEADHTESVGLFQYFTGEIISGEPRKIRDLFAASAILETITPEACDALLGTAGSEQSLQDLSRRNLFIFRVGKDEYKYHRLFQEFLLEQSSAEAKREIHQKAAEYYQQQGMNERAIGHWLAAGDSARAAGLIAQIADELKEQGRNGILSDWLGKIPSETYEQQPQLLVVKASLLRDLGNLEEAEAMLLQAQRLLSKNTSSKSVRSYALADALLEYGGLHWVKGDFPKTLRLLKKALAACPSSNAELKASILNGIGMIWNEVCNWENAKSCLLKARSAVTGIKRKFLHVAIENNLAALWNSQGEKEQAYNQYVLLIEQIGDNYYLQVGTIFCSAARTALEYGQIVWAEKCLNQGQTVCKYINDMQSQAALLYGFGSLHVANRQWQLAERSFQTALAQYRSMGRKNMEISSLLELGSLKRYCGDYGKAKEYYNQALSELGQSDNYLRAALLLCLSKTESLCLDFTSAGRRIGEAQSILKRIGDTSMEFTVLSAKAALYCSQGLSRRSLPVLRRMIRLSKNKGYHGVMMRELQHTPHLAQLASGCRDELKYLEFLKTHVASDKSGIPGAAPVMIRFLGDLRMLLPGGREIPLKWRSHKVASLFAYLLVHRARLCSNEELMTAFWPRENAELAIKNLRSSIFRLRETLAIGLRAAGNANLSGNVMIVHQERGYRIDSSFACRIDVDEFKNQWHESKTLKHAGKIEESRKCLQRCLELYQGEFLVNYGESWCEEQREETRKIHLACLKEIAAVKREQHEYDEAIELYQRCIQSDPYSENVRIELWKTLKAADRTAAIHKDFRELQKILRRDIKEGPTAETIEQYQRLTAKEVAR